MTEQSSIHGSCLCQALRFHFQPPSLWCAHCHCTMCRKMHGAGYVTWVGVNEADFVIDEGEEYLRWYQSSDQARRGGCNQCGSIMLFQSKRWPGEMHIALGSLDDDMDREPELNAYFDTHVEWMPIDNRIGSKPAPSEG